MISPLRRLLTATLLASCFTTAAHAQLPPALAGGNFKIVVGYAAGGAADSVARRYAEQLKDAGFGSVIVENRPGASARLGWDAVKKAKPDGLTVYLTPSPLLTIMPFTYKAPGYDAEKDLTPVALLVEIPTAVVASVSQPYADLKQYVAWAKQNPKQATLGLATVGSSGHLGTLALGKSQGFEVTPVPYRGASPMLIDVVSAQLSLGWDALASMVPLYKGGKIRILGISGEQRLASLPEVPTAKEQGFSEYVPASSWYGIYAPAGTPTEALAALEAAFLKAAGNPTLKRSLEDSGLVARAEGRAAVAERVKRERETWAPIVKASGIAIDE